MRRVTLVASLIMIMVVTTGCMKAVMRFNPDGSGTFEIGFNLSVQNLQEAGEMSGGGGSDEGMEGMIALIETGKPIVDEETGLAVSAAERLENGSMWTYIIVDVPDAESWAELEDATSGVLPSDTDDAPADPSQLTAVPVITVTDNTIRVELTVPPSVDPDMEMEEDPFGMAAIMGAFVQISYELDMPGTLTDHNGQIDSLTGNPVWLLDMASTEELVIYAEATLD